MSEHVPVASPKTPWGLVLYYDGPVRYVNIPGSACILCSQAEVQAEGNPGNPKRVALVFEGVLYFMSQRRFVWGRVRGHAHLLNQSLRGALKRPLHGFAH